MKNNFKKVVSDGKSKGILIFVVLAIAAGAGAMFFLGSEEAPVQQSALRKPPSTSLAERALNTGEVNPLYEKSVKEADQNRVVEAANSGKSALPSVVGGSINKVKPLEELVIDEEPVEIVRPTISQSNADVKPVVLPMPIEKDNITATTVLGRAPQTAENLELSRPSSAAPVAPPEPVLVERPVAQVNAELQAAYLNQMARIGGRRNQLAPNPTQVDYPSEVYASSEGGSYVGADAPVQTGSGLSDVISLSRNGGSQTNAFESSPNEEDTTSELARLVSEEEYPFDMPLTGDILYGISTMEANTDAPGPVRVKLLQGDLAGSILMGGFRVANENLILEFTSLTVKETVSGKVVNDTFPIKAVAIDPEHMRPGQATYVNRHLAQRIAVTFGTSFIKGMSEAIQTSGAVSTVSEYGSVESTPVLSAKDKAIVATGTAAGDVGDILSEYYGSRPTTVKVEAETPMGILFLQ